MFRLLFITGHVNARAVAWHQPWLDLTQVNALCSAHIVTLIDSDTKCSTGMLTCSKQYANATVLAGDTRAASPHLTSCAVTHGYVRNAGETWMAWRPADTWAELTVIINRKEKKWLYCGHLTGLFIWLCVLTKHSFGQRAAQPWETKQILWKHNSTERTVRKWCSRLCNPLQSMFCLDISNRNNQPQPWEY